jgi:predicted metal-dependent HD superfamily phosphohydrolase
MSDVARSWARAWKGCGARSAGDDVRDSVLACYGEPHRRYHTFQHLAECLNAFEAVQGIPNRPAEVEAALWFHDAIYDAKRSDNELRSAAWAKQALSTAGALPATADRVFDLVMATRHDAVPDDLDAQLLVDIDLAILGASESRYAEYEEQIRSEYSFVPVSTFERKRRAILRSFLERPHVYATGHFRTALEERAKANLRRAIGRRAAGVARRSPR